MPFSAFITVGLAGRMTGQLGYTRYQTRAGQAGRHLVQSPGMLSRTKLLKGGFDWKYSIKQGMEIRGKKITDEGSEVNRTKLVSTNNPT